MHAPASHSQQSSFDPNDKELGAILAQIEDFINDVEASRIQTVSIFPYAIDENSEISILFRRKKIDSKQCGMYMGFGTSVKYNDPNVLFSAARSLVTKSAGLLVASELPNLSMPREIRRIVQDVLNKGRIQLFTNKKIKEILGELVHNKFTLHMEVIAENHLTIFYPMPFFRVEPVNQVFADKFDGTRYQDYSMHWVALSQIVRPEFFNNFISGFNFQLICYMSEKVISRMYLQDE